MSPLIEGVQFCLNDGFMLCIVAPLETEIGCKLAKMYLLTYLIKEKARSKMLLHARQDFCNSPSAILKVASYTASPHSFVLLRLVLFGRPE